MIGKNYLIEGIVRDVVRHAINEADARFVPDLRSYAGSEGFSPRRASKFQRVNMQGGKSYISNYYKQQGLDRRQIGRKIRRGGSAPLTTIASDGTEETSKPITTSDVVLNNVGNRENRWSPTADTFRRKYERVGNGNVYKPKGGPMLSYGPLREPIRFNTPWGTEETVDTGGYIMQDPNNENDIYGISGNDFENSYRFDEAFRRKVGSILNEEIARVLYNKNNRY